MKTNLEPGWHQKLIALANRRLDFEDSLARQENEKAAMLDRLFSHEMSQLRAELKENNELASFGQIFNEILAEQRAERDVRTAIDVQRRREASKKEAEELELYIEQQNLQKISETVDKSPLLRSIRTEFFFRSSEILGRPEALHDRAADVGFAWIAETSSGLRDAGTIEGTVVVGDPVEITRKYLDLTLRGTQITSPDVLHDGNILNEATISKLLEQDLIVERSPPLGIKLKELLRDVAAPVRIGVALSVSTVVGAVAAGGAAEAAVMIVSLAGGILVIGGAVILTEWLRRRLLETAPLRELGDTHTY